MKDQFFEVAELDAIRASLQTLRADLLDDLARVRQLPAREMSRLLRERTAGSRAQTDALLDRLVELREVVDSRRRTLQRLRAQMRQIRGGMRPH